MTIVVRQQLEPGIVVAERYRVIRKLGDGGMGAVYEGEHIAIKRRVAIKVIHGHFADRPEILERFNREAQAATAIGHPNIIEVTDFGTLPDSMPFMVLEYLDGRDWSHDIEHEGAQPLGKTAQILTQVCRALSAAHGKGIVHRDLKPDNIFLISREGNPHFAKILDFGISKFMDADTAPQEFSLTKTGTALGTPYYMSPEQCSGRRDVDHRADIFALGVILFRALTGGYPFDAESYPMLIMAIVTGPTPSLAAHRPDVPADLVALVERMLAKQREDRPQSCADIEAVLRHYVGDTNGAGALALDSAPSVHGAPPAEVVSKSRRPALVAVGAFAVLVAIAGGFFGMHVFDESQRDDDVVPPSATAANDSPPPTAADAAAHEELPTVEPGEPAAEPGEPTTIHVRIEATPADAVIVLGDEDLANPFEGDLPRGGQRRLVVRADGYETHERDVALDAAQQIAVHLARAPARPAPVRERPRVQPAAVPQPFPPPPPTAAQPPRQRERRVEGTGRFSL